MNEWMKILFSLSLSGTLIGLLVLLLPKLFKKRLSKTWQYYIWIIVAARLLIPFAPENNLMNNLNNLSNGVSYENRKGIDDVNNLGEYNLSEYNLDNYNLDENNLDENNLNNITSIIDEYNINDNQLISYPYNYFLDNKVDSINEINESADGNIGKEKNEHISNQIETDADKDIKPFTSLLNELNSNLFYIWFLIAILLFVKKITTYFNYVRYIKAGCKEIYDDLTMSIYINTCQELGIKNPLPIFTNSMSASASLVGIIKRFIILPSTELTEDEIYYIFKHELTHHKRNDIIYKWILQLAACIHWFNPFVYKMIKKHDKLCELSCDEVIIKNMNYSEQRSYGDTLLSAVRINGTYMGSITSVTLNEDSKLLKERLESIMNFKKKNRLTIGITMLITGGFIIGAVFSGVYTNLRSTKTEIAEGAGIVESINITSVLEDTWTYEEYAKEQVDYFRSKYQGDILNNSYWGYSNDYYDYNYDYSYDYNYDYDYDYDYNYDYDYDYDYDYNNIYNYNDDDFQELNSEAEDIFTEISALNIRGIEYGLDLNSTIEEFNMLFDKFMNEDNYNKKALLLNQLESILYIVEGMIDAHEDMLYLFDDIEFLKEEYEYLKDYAKAIGGELNINEEEFYKMADELSSISNGINHDLYKKLEEILENAEDKLDKAYGKSYSSYQELYNADSSFQVIKIDEQNEASALNNGWYKTGGYYYKVIGPFYHTGQDYAFFEINNSISSQYKLGTSFDASMNYSSLYGNKGTAYNHIVNVCSKLDGSYYVFLAVEDISNLEGNIYIPYSEKNIGLDNIVKYKDIPTVKQVNIIDEKFKEGKDLTNIKININNANVKIVKATGKNLEYSYPEKSFKVESSLKGKELTITIEGLTKNTIVWDDSKCIIYIPDDIEYNYEIVNNNSGVHIQNIKGNFDVEMIGAALTAELVKNQKINVHGSNSACTIMYENLENIALNLSTSNSAVSLPSIMKDYIMNKDYEFINGNGSTHITIALTGSALTIK